MAFSPWPPTAGAPPPQGALAAASAGTRERQSVEEEGSVAGAQETTTRIPPEQYHSHLESEEHAEKIKKYQATLAARLKAKHFSSKTLEKGNMFEEIVIQSETIQLSRWPFTRLFADPAKVYREESCTEKDISLSHAGEAMSKN
ncbi:hypothetical protein QOZ80_8BG0664080 [Eleusine coracana subsp. coracana]|nr:hypothetical protein QOZ80_8BG0664080 [Eleusine coracana subsp. coracana]